MHHTMAGEAPTLSALQAPLSAGMQARRSGLGATQDSSSGGVAAQVQPESSRLATQQNTLLAVASQPSAGSAGSAAAVNTTGKKL